ncbi:MULTISPECIES: hypothetical protein [unclassified Thioalkalivibrio]|uniref:hypothetical protein n=1 Tax=unclassified Thioalkalivibrio TaxID=2621013 RepID=UPI000361C8E3|nr:MULTISPECIES: hypothetical protein [unclassified Thioalkalivibrio]
MEVIYKQPILLEVGEAIDKAKADNKRIEKIILNKEEWNEMLDSMRGSSRFVYPPACRSFKYKGVTIERKKEMEW